MVVQWKVMMGLTVLVQQFGCAAHNFALQAVAILIARTEMVL
jgi:hypothetical protein